MNKPVLVSLLALFAFGNALAAPQATLLDSLSDANKAYYALSFNYAMETVQADQPYNWETYEGRGNITPERVFKSKSGSQCRVFSEAYTIGGQEGQNSGVACKRVGKDGWCKLKKTDAYTCALEPPDNAIEEKLRDAGEAIDRQKTTVNTWSYWWKNLW